MRAGATAEYQKALIRRLRQPETIKTFVKTRDGMGVGANVGLGSLPSAHGAYSAAALAKLDKWNDGSYSYPEYNILPSWGTLSATEARELFVVPPRSASIFSWLLSPVHQIKQSHSPWLVSICQYRGRWGPLPQEEAKLLDVTDKVLTGFFAHEFAHYVNKFIGLSGRTESVLAAWERTASKREELPRTVRMDCGTEVKTDLIAASLGFKEEILAKNQYMMDCVTAYVEPPPPTGLETRPSEIRAEVKYRNEQVRLLLP